MRGEEPVNNNTINDDNYNYNDKSNQYIVKGCTKYDTIESNKLLAGVYDTPPSSNSPKNNTHNTVMDLEGASNDQAVFSPSPIPGVVLGPLCLDVDDIMDLPGLAGEWNEEDSIWNDGEGEEGEIGDGGEGGECSEYVGRQLVQSSLSHVLSRNGTPNYPLPNPQSTLPPLLSSASKFRSVYLPLPSSLLSLLPPSLFRTLGKHGVSVLTLIVERVGGVGIAVHGWRALVGEVWGKGEGEGERERCLGVIARNCKGVKKKDFDDIVMNCNFPNLSEDEADDVRLQFATVYYSG